MKNHLLTYWPFGLESRGFKNLCNKLEIEKCTYIYDDEREKLNKSGFYGIWLYNGLSYYFASDDERAYVPLDKEIIEKFRPYEMTAMDIINRWRRSFTADENYAEIKRLYYIFLSYWWDYINSNGVTHLFLGAVPHIPQTYIPYAVCKVMGIPVLFIEPMAAFDGERQNHLLKESIEVIHSDFNNLYENNRQKYKDNSTEIFLKPEMEQYFKQYSHDNNSIKRIIVDNGQDSLKEKMQLYLQRIKLYVNRGDIRILIKKGVYTKKLKKKSKKIMSYEEKLATQPDLSKRFIFFPLHYQPEATTMPGAGVYENQLLVIKILSYCLPPDVYLYVKEHPAFWKIKERREGMYEARSKHYYDEIVSLRNVKLISHEYNSLDLMDHCMALVTGTGTAGLEALFKNRLVIVFGNARYKEFKYAYALNNMVDCKIILDKILKDITGRVTYDENLRELRIFAKTLEPMVCSFDWGYIRYSKNGLSERTEKDIEDLSEKIVERFMEISKNGVI